MSASYFDLLKYAATGIASPDMTYYDKMRASTLMGGAVQTLTGQPPLSFKSNGTPLISWSMKGNGQQTGTLSPDNIIMPTFCGVRTENLFDSAVYELVPVSASAQRKGTNLGVLPQGTYTFNAVSAASAIPIYRTIKNGGTYTFEAINSLPYTFTADGVSEQIIRTSGTNGNTWADAGYSNMMLNLGSTALPYEPYGWAEKITCAGQTTPVYLGEVPTVRRIRKLVLTGKESWAKNDSTGSTLYYLRNVIQNVVVRSVYCTHLPSLVAYGTTLACSTATPNILFINFGTAIMNAQASGNTAAGLKEYLAAQYAAGTPVIVWYVLAEPETAIVNEPLCKIGDYADELNSTDVGVTIPTVNGSNTLTVDTELQPSEMSITYRG